MGSKVTRESRDGDLRYAGAKSEDVSSAPRKAAPQLTIFMGSTPLRASYSLMSRLHSIPSMTGICTSVAKTKKGLPASCAVLKASKASAPSVVSQ